MKGLGLVLFMLLFIDCNKRSVIAALHNYFSLQGGIQKLRLIFKRNIQAFLQGPECHKEGGKVVVTVVQFMLEYMK